MFKSVIFNGETDLYKYKILILYLISHNMSMDPTVTSEH